MKPSERRFPLVSFTLAVFALISLVRSDPAAADDAAANRAVIERLYAGFQSGDVEAIVTLMDDGVEWIAAGPAVIPFAGRFEGKEAIRSFFTLAGTVLDVLEQRIDGYLCDQDKVAVLVHEHMRVKATQKEYRTDAVHLYTLREGRIVRFEEFVDTATQAAAFMAE